VTDPETLKALPGPVLGIFAGADQSISLEDVNAFEQGLESASIPHQISVYDGQPHAFVHGADEIQAGGAQGKAWNEMLTFLETNLRHGTALNRSINSNLSIAPFDLRYYLMLVYEHAFGSAKHTH
jgi:acetyl esterase/lipase